MPARQAAACRSGEFELLSKSQLHSLADRLLSQETLAVQQCIEFVVAETQGVWHGRARAMMCRRLKHCRLDEGQSRQLVACITRRLVEGAFSEQFKDQLRLAMHLDPSLLFQHARDATKSPMAHVRRYAQWVLSHMATDST